MRGVPTPTRTPVYYITRFARLQAFFAYFQKIYLTIDNIVKYIILYPHNADKYSKNNLFCQRVTGMLYDSLIKNLIAQAYLSRKDVFFSGVPDDIRSAFDDGVKTVFLLPGAFSLCGEDDFSDIRNSPSCSGIMKSIRTLFADCRFMADDAFREALTENGFSRIAVMFPECAVSEEYGFRETLRWVGEYRACRRDFVQVTGFSSPCCTPLTEYGGFYGRGEAIAVCDEDESPSFSCFEVKNPASKFYTAAEYALKYAFDRTVIYLNSREEARAFQSFLGKRGVTAHILDGALTSDERQSVLKSFILGDKNILVATKAFIPSSFFCPPDRVIFCGVPFSLSHLYRSGSACKKHPPTVIFCEDDIRRNEKIISSLADALGNSSSQEKRLKGLENIKNLLKSNQ